MTHGGHQEVLGVQPPRSTHDASITQITSLKTCNVSKSSFVYNNSKTCLREGQ